MHLANRLLKFLLPIILVAIWCPSVSAFYFRGGSFTIKVTTNKYRDGDPVALSGPSVVQFLNDAGGLVLSVDVSKLAPFGLATTAYSVSLPAGSYTLAIISAERNAGGSAIATDVNAVAGLPNDPAPSDPISVKLVPPHNIAGGPDRYILYGK